MKKYRLLKDLPDWPKGSEITVDNFGFILGYSPLHYPDFFEPIIEWPKSVDEIHNAKLKNYTTDSVFAYQKLLLLAAEMNGDWIPDWNNSDFKYIVLSYKDCLKIDSHMSIRLNIAFSTREAAEFSLEHHHELWEQYYMMK